MAENFDPEFPWALIAKSAYVAYHVNVMGGDVESARREWDRYAADRSITLRGSNVGWEAAARQVVAIVEEIRSSSSLGKLVIPDEGRWRGWSPPQPIPACDPEEIVRRIKRLPRVWCEAIRYAPHPGDALRHAQEAMQQTDMVNYTAADLIRAVELIRRK